MDNIIIQAITLGVMVGAFVCGKYVFPNMPKNVADKLNDLAPWAGKFVVWAREFMKASTGQEKMDAVVKELYKIAEEKGIKVTENQLKAIAQAAYEAMKAGEKEAGTQETQAMYYKIGQREVAKAPIVNVFTGGAQADRRQAVATDNVPEGALEENQDGTVNVYGDDGQKVGTLEKETADQLSVGVEVVVESE